MKTLIEELFKKDRLMSYIRDFTLFEVENDKIVKKGAKLLGLSEEELALLRRRGRKLPGHLRQRIPL